MEFLNKRFKVENMNMMLTILKKDDYVCVIEVNTSDKTNQPVIFNVPVSISSTMYVESVAIHVQEEFKKRGIEYEWKINNRVVEQFKVKCKFKGTKISQVSSILVLHKNMKKWIYYPFSILGNIVYD